MGIADYIINSWTHRGDITQVVTGEDERDEKQWKLDQKGDSPAVPVPGSDRFRTEAPAGIPVADQST